MTCDAERDIAVLCPEPEASGWEGGSVVIFKGALGCLTTVADVLAIPLVDKGAISADVAPTARGTVPAGCSCAMESASAKAISSLNLDGVAVVALRVLVMAAARDLPLLNEVWELSLGFAFLTVAGRAEVAGDEVEEEVEAKLGLLVEEDGVGDPLVLLAMRMLALLASLTG